MRKNLRLRILSFIILAIAGIGYTAYYWISNAPKRALEKQIIAMQGMPINLNFKNAQSIIAGIDSTFVSLPRKKLVVFVDSTSCTSCFIGKLVEYFEINDTLNYKSAQLLVIMHPKDINHEEVINRLHNERYPFWCIIDSKGEFLKNNHKIPDNKLLHSFMLNEGNNIILVGNPLKNYKIKKLYYKIL